MTGAAHVGGGMEAARVEAVEEPIDPIVALVQGGKHREALTACATTHGVILGRLCMALLGSQADADEATQETLLRAHRAMATYRAEGSIKAWLCGIARHVCAHMLETRRKQRDLLEVVPTNAEGRDEIAQRSGAMAKFALRQRARAIRDALDKLKPTEREALVMRFVGDLSHREIAIACNLDEPAARKRLSRALARLRSVMPDEESI